VTLCELLEPGRLNSESFVCSKVDCGYRMPPPFGCLFAERVDHESGQAGSGHHAAVLFGIDRLITNGFANGLTDYFGDRRHGQRLRPCNVQ